MEVGIYIGGGRRKNIRFVWGSEGNFTEVYGSNGDGELVRNFKLRGVYVEIYIYEVL